MSGEPLERPQVTVVDPRTGETFRADVVGDDREPRRLPAWVAPFAVGALLAVLAVPPATTAVQDGRRAERAAAVLAEQRATDDRLALVVTRPRLYSHGVGELYASVTLFSTGGRGVAIEEIEVVGIGLLAGVPLDGDDVTEPGTITPALSPVERGAGTRVDCARAAEALRTTGAALRLAVVVRATPHSGRQQATAPVEVPEEEVRENLARACDLGAGAVPLEARVTVGGDRLVVTLRTLLDRDVTVLGHRAYGATLRSTRAVPFLVRRGRVVRTELEVVRLVECEYAEIGGLVVLFRADDGSTSEVPAELAGDEPGLQELVARLRRASC